jgi:hypothetical protein
MQLKNLSTALFVKDINNSKNFYINNLQQKIQFDFGKNVIFESGLAIWEISNTHIIPEKLGIHNLKDSKSNRFEMYLETDNLEEIYGQLKKENIVFLHEIHEEPWGQCTIRFFDPDHHLIEIGESMEVFVGKFHKQGLTPEQISARTSVSLSDVKRILNLK